MGQTAAALCGHRAPSPGLPAHITLVSLPFHVIFYPKKIFFKSFKKKDISNMQILEPSRPTPKCEHFHIDIRAQRQALGNVCVHSLHVRVRACVLVWNCVCEHALAQSVLTVRACLRACEGFNCGFPFDSVHAFPLFFWHWSNVLIVVICF